ncbi:hypothetical protein CP02DC14_1378B, partial [Chlamydia psittaci 02DC14]
GPVRSDCNRSGLV